MSAITFQPDVRSEMFSAKIQDGEKNLCARISDFVKNIFAKIWEGIKFMLSCCGLCAKNIMLRDIVPNIEDIKTKLQSESKSVQADAIHSFREEIMKYVESRAKDFPNVARQLKSKVMDWTRNREAIFSEFDAIGKEVKKLRLAYEELKVVITDCKKNEQLIEDFKRFDKSVCLFFEEIDKFAKTAIVKRNIYVVILMCTSLKAVLGGLNLLDRERFRWENI